MDAEAWRHAKGVLAEALLCPPNEREAFVNARCIDPSLRREVQAYLTQYDESFLESVLTVSGTFDSASSAAAAEAREALDINIGDRVGPYIVLDRLGVGGMGHVFLGNDTRLQRKVALKCLTASASAAELRSRILHEARAAARITHPNIAIVHDVIDHDSRPFLVMEYVEGENLAVVIKRGQLPLDTILTMTRQLASALSAAHAKGIVHRDLKPANIQVTPDGSVKILDFGVAHAMSVVVTETTTPPAQLTVHVPHATVQGDRVAMHPGTPAYMSPEQMFGRKIDQRSDLYSLGVIVYEMATGHRPYAVDDPLELVLTLSRNFLHPGAAVTPLPTQVGDIVAKMLSVSPDDRYQTAAALEAAIAGLSVPGPASARPVASSAASKARVVLRIAGVTLLAAAGVTALGYMETTAFNLTLGRTPPFDRESPSAWLLSGMQSLFLPALYLIAIFIALWAVRFTVRVLSLSRGIDQLLTDGVTRTTRLSLRLGLNDPAAFGQAVAGVGIVALAALVTRFWPFMRAWGTLSISTRPAGQFVLLQSTGQGRIDAQWFKFLLVVLIFGFGAAVARIQRLRTGQSIRLGGPALAVVSTMLIVTLVLCLLPYRILLKNAMPRLDVAGERCFALGEAADELLIHCPDRTPPRNRIVKSTDPSVHRLGVIESIFDAPGKTP